MFDAIKSILYLTHRTKSRYSYTTTVPAPGACHKNDLAPAGPDPGIKMILRQVLLLRPTVVVSSQQRNRVLLLMKASSQKENSNQPAGSDSRYNSNIYKVELQTAMAAQAKLAFFISPYVCPSTRVCVCV